MSVLEITDGQTIPSKTARRRVMPDPPNYVACIAHAEAVARKPATDQSGQAHAQLKIKCRQLRQALEAQALNLLISAAWLIDECAEHGVTVSDREVTQRFARLRAEEFPRRGDFQRYLALTGHTLADELFLAKREALSEKLLQKILGEGGRDALAKFERDSKQKQTSRTDCRSGYVVQGCKQYDAAKATAGPSVNALLEEIDPSH
jgi:hypothetical protein